MLYLQMLSSPSEKDKFEQIYTLYRGLMFYVARRILPGEADAEDAVHQAFVSIIENLKKISEIRCPKTRLLRRYHNRAQSHRHTPQPFPAQSGGV